MRLAVALLALLVAAATPSRAQVDGPSRLTLTWENDLLAGTDRHYTNGLRIELAGRLDPRVLPNWLHGDEAEWGIAVGQQIYTPERLGETALLTDDRPYAGWSYLALSVTRRAAALAWEDRIEFTLGVVGPSSGAQATHELAHDLFGSEAPRGWRHQLRDEPTLSLAYRASAQLTRGQAGGLTYNVRTSLGVSVGNVATFASLGAAARFGLGVPDATPDWPPPLRLYVTASVEARLVGYDVFLDGSLLHRGDRRVAKERVVVDVSLGFVLAVHDRLSLTYTHTFRTREFEGQLGGDQFGSVSLAISW